MGFPTSAISGINTLLKRGDAASPEVFTTIAEVRSISGPSAAVEVIDVTNHDSTSATREKVPGLIDPGQLTFDINFQPTEATHDDATGLIQEFETRATSNYRIVFPSPVVHEFGLAAFVTGLPMNFPTDEVITANVTLEISGAIDFSA